MTSFETQVVLTAVDTTALSVSQLRPLSCQNCYLYSMEAFHKCTPKIASSQRGVTGSPQGGFHFLMTVSKLQQSNLFCMTVGVPATVCRATHMQDQLVERPPYTVFGRKKIVD